MQDYKKKFLRQKGQVAVIVTMLIVCLLGAVALVIDIGSLYQKRGFFQSVADASALAGVQELPENRDAAVVAAADYAARNNVDIIYNCRDFTSEEIEISSTLSTNDTITVALSNREAPLYFAKIFGQDTVSLGAFATAMVGEPVQLYYVVPWLAIIPEGTIWEEYLDPGTEKIIHGDPDESDFLAWDSTDEPGGWLSRYRDRIINGYSEPLKEGDAIYARIINPSQTRNATYDRVGWTFDPFNDLVTYIDGIIKLAENDTQFVIVPVSYEVEVPHHANDKWSEEVEIIAFAPFVLTGIEGHGSNTRVVGRFIHQAVIVTSSDIKAFGQAGIKAIRLIR
jgi:Flp pilus assembly protein TadG